MNPLIKRLVIITAIVCVAVALVSYHPQSPAETTYAHMKVTERRVRDYVAKNRTLPATLADLAGRDGNRDASLADGWGRELLYEARGDGTVTLSSRGRTGKVEADDTMNYVFQIRAQ